MARLARVVVPGLPHHITQRGNRRQETFFCGDNYQQWALDALGNWAQFRSDTNADGVIDEDDTPQTRSADPANQITAISGTGAPAGQPAYDATGNMVFDGTNHYVYDAWNRLVAASADDPNDPGQPGELLARYAYDGRGYRIAKAVALYADEENPGVITGYDRTDFPYNDPSTGSGQAGWRVLQENVAG